MSDKNHILTDCPECGAEHRVHKMRAAHGTVRCTNCGFYFYVSKTSVQERAFLEAFGGGGR